MPKRRGRGLAAVACVASLVATSAGWSGPDAVGAVAPVAAGCDAQRFLDDGTVRVGIDLDAGGSISWISHVDRPENLVNTYDLGRYVQQSYYAEPQPFIPPGAVQNPGWAGFPWNPIQAGDSYGNQPEVLALGNDGTTLYVKTIPMQWALQDVPAEATMESWITLPPDRPGVVAVHNRLVNARTDPVDHQTAARHQELPAVYTNEPYVHLWSYVGDAPFTGAAPTEIAAGFPWSYWRGSESWAALLDDGGWGLGVVTPGAVDHVGGHFDVSPATQPVDTGYVAPLHTEIIDHDLVYEYDYELVVGPLSAIRAEAAARRADPRPELVFAHDRQHVRYVNATDAGPPQGFLDIDVAAGDPQVLSAPTAFQAGDVPRLYVRAAFDTTDTHAQLHFADADGQFAADRIVDLDVIADGVARTYEVDLSANPSYAGTIGGLRFDPVTAGAPGDRVRLEWISWRPEPEIPPAPVAPAVPVLDAGACPAAAPSTTAPPAAPAPAPPADPAPAQPRFTG